MPSYTLLEGNDLQNYLSATRGQSDSILLYNADDSVDGVDGNDIVVAGLGNDTITIFTQQDNAGFSFSLNGAAIYGDGQPNSQAGGSVDDPLGNDSIDISLPGRGPQVFTGATNTLLDAGAGVDTIYGWSNISLTTALGGAGEDSLRWGWGKRSMLTKSAAPSRRVCSKVASAPTR